MSDPKAESSKAAEAVSALQAANLPHKVVGNNVAVDFRIQDLVSRLGGVFNASHCSGCLGCSGCKV
jgi:hypothetical protein